MEVNNKKALEIKELGSVNIKPIVDVLDSLEWDTQEDFEANYNKNDKGALRKTQHAILRFADKRSDEIQYKNTSRWAVLKDILLPAMNHISSIYGYEQGFYPKVMFAKLPSGEFIPPHIDGTTKGYIPHKIHLPLQTNDKAFFFLENERHHLKTGIGYEVNNGRRHSVVNGGPTDRIHLIFEYLNADLQPPYIQTQIAKLNALGD